MAKQSKQAHHWADATAERIVRQRGERDRYVLAAGITPSGTVHFGNMREIITPELVPRSGSSASAASATATCWPPASPRPGPCTSATCARSSRRSW
jgi:hypothetical protein